MKKLSNELKYFFSGSIFLGASSIYSLIIPIIIIPYLISTVGLSNYGLSVIAFSVTFFLSLIIDFGYNITGVNSLSKCTSEKEKGEIIVRALYVKSILFLLTLFLFGIISLAIPYVREHYLLFLLSLCVPFSSVFNLNWALQGLQLIKKLSVINILNKTIYLIGIFLFIRNPEDYVYINFLFGSGILITGLYSFYLIKKKTHLMLIPFTIQDLWYEIKESRHYFVSNISIYISTNLYPIILSFFTSSEIVGVFAAVEKIYNVLRSPFSIYINLMLPRISTTIERSKKEAIRVVKKTYIFVVFFILILVFLSWNFQQEIIEYFVKDYFDLSIHLHTIALVGIIVVIFNCPFYILLLAMDEKKAIMRTFLIIPIVGILACMLLSKYYEAKGVFYTIVLVEVLYVISLQLLYNKISKQH